MSIINYLDFSTSLLQRLNSLKRCFIRPSVIFYTEANIAQFN